MTNKLSTLRWTLGGILLSSSLGIGIWGLSTSNVLADRDRYEREKHHEEYGSSSANIQSNPLYTQECGGCHLAYPANLLPASSWKAMMAGLEDHFGDNAELNQQDKIQIENYLVENAGKNERYGNLRDSVTLRITELPYFIKEHDEVPTRMVEGNKQVGSFSKCDACHNDAVRGRFDEDQIHIPGFGRWDD